MKLKNYKTAFLLKPTLTKEEVGEAVQKVVGLLETEGAVVVHQPPFLLRTLAYPVEKFEQSFYQTIEFQAPPEAISVLEINYKRDENFLRFLTTHLDKHGVAYHEYKRNNPPAGEEGEENPATT